MITVYGEGRGFRVAWLLEEMGLAYRVRPVDLFAGAENDPEFMAVNPGGFIPAVDDGGTIIVESIAILQYLMGKYGPTPLALGPDDPGFAAYLQFLHLGEAGLAGPVNAVFVDRNIAPEAERGTWTGGWALGTFERRMRLVLRQLAQAAYIAGDRFTAADISVTYALQFAQRTIGHHLSDLERDYVARTTGRDAYARAMDACAATKAWVDGLAAQGRLD